MRKLLVVLGLLLFALPAYGQDQSPEVYCTNLSTWVLSVTIKKISGVSKDNVIEVLTQEEGENLPPELPGIVEAVYSPNMPELREGKDIAAVIAIFAEQCMAEVKRRQGEE